MTTTQDQSSKKRVVRRVGKARRPRYYDYPKRYEMIVDIDESSDAVILSRRSENFSAHELYGLLRMTLLDIERQLLIKPEDGLDLP